jgi:large conductance mechanosensitive channel
MLVSHCVSRQKPAYGVFIDDCVNFVIIAAVVFFMVKAINRIQNKQAAKAEATTKTCPFCLSTIPLKATRCAHCIMELKTE